MKVDAGKSKGVNRLAKAYTKDGGRYSVVKTTARLVLSELTMEDNAVPLDAGSAITVDSAVDARFDGGSPAGGQTGVMTIKLSGDLPNGTIKLTGTSKLSKTVEVLGRK